MTKPGNIKYILLFLIIVPAVWLAFFAIPAPDAITLTSGDGFFDLSGADFDNAVYTLGDYWQSYPAKLYAPEDFASGRVSEPPRYLVGSDYQGEDGVQFATHRTRVKLPVGVSLSADVVSCDFSMRLFINGMEADSVGVPGESKETTVPRKDRRVYSFASGGEAEFIAQAANFHHREGAWIPGLTIGSAENIARYARADLVRNVIVAGALLTACLYHLGLFLLNRRLRAALLFSVCCLLLLLRTNTLLPMFFPDYDWYFAMRLEYLSVYGAGAFLALFIRTLYPHLFHKWAMRAFYALSALSALSVLLLEPALFTRLIIVNQAATALMMAYVLASLALDLRKRDAQTFLAFLGIGVVCVCAVLDILHTNALIRLPAHSLSPVGMMFFVFAYALVVALDYAKTERAYLEAREKIAEINARYDELMQTAKKHTPGELLERYGLARRETDVVLLLIGGKSRAEIGKVLSLSTSTVNTYCERAYKKMGVKSVGDLLKLLGG